MQPRVRLTPTLLGVGRRAQTRVKLILQMNAPLLALLDVVVTRRLDALLDTADFMIQFVIGLEQRGELRILHLQLVNGLAILRELVHEIMLVDIH